ncbi:MAG: NAD(P)/FAD-dependent oxidoreductase [Oscillospiraceae bacterium]
MYDVAIIGSGPAGLTAAIYAKRALLRAVIIEKEYLGTGQISVTERVENYPGLYGISGYELGKKFREQAETLGAEFLEGVVTALTRDGCWKITLEDGSVIESKTVIYAAGTSYRRLGVKGDDKQRISYCAVCDGALYKDKTVAVIGGGDTALGDALYLSNIAKTVYLVHRRAEFRANKSLQKKVREKQNIQLVLEAVLNEVTGGDKADGIIYTQGGDRKKLAADGIFCAIGSAPNTALLNGVCELDASRYIIAGEDGVTSAEGLFAAGDVRTTPLRQVITAAADGANAATSAERYLTENCG